VIVLTRRAKILVMIDHSAFAILQEAVGLVEEQERFFLPHFLLWAYGT